MGHIKKIYIWVLHEFKEILLNQRFNICDLHLKGIIIGDEIWIIFKHLTKTIVVLRKLIKLNNM